MKRQVVLSPELLPSGLWTYRLVNSEGTFRSSRSFVSQVELCDDAKRLCRELGLVISLTLSGVESVS